MTDSKPRAADSMTSPTTNTVTDDDLRRILADSLRYYKLEREAGDAGSGQNTQLVMAALSAMRRVAALSTHPNTGMEDRATARGDK